jgi:hypothetical protein
LTVPVYYKSISLRPLCKEETDVTRILLIDFSETRKSKEHWLNVDINEEAANKGIVNCTDVKLIN